MIEQVSFEYHQFIWVKWHLTISMLSDVVQLILDPQHLILFPVEAMVLS